MNNVYHHFELRENEGEKVRIGVYFPKTIIHKGKKKSPGTDISAVIINNINENIDEG